MTRQEIITLAESLGLLYPEPKSSSDYNHPAHMRLISKLEKFAQEIERKVLQGVEDDVESDIKDLIKISEGENSA